MKKILYLFAILCALIGCRKVPEIVPSTPSDVTPPKSTTQYKGFFLLNEGNMGSNKCTLDYFDYESGVYTKNIYAERNPSVVQELGDVGNDIKIYGGKIYAVVNCSHFVEILDVHNARHITQISIPNCRYVEFKDGYAYVSSYAGPVQIDPNARLGYVAKVDTTTLKVVAECTVGYQPEEMVIKGNKLYVANSGGYRVPNYDRTVSVIDLDKFEVVKTIDVAINLHRLKMDSRGFIYVSSRGDYYNVKSDIFVIDSSTDEVVRSGWPTMGADGGLGIPCSHMTICGDSMYVYSTEWSYQTSQNTISYALFNTATRTVQTRNFITDGTDKQIKIPYGIAVNPEAKEIFVTDAGNYVTPGYLYCFGYDGVLKWKTMAGDIPAHFAFTTVKLSSN